MCIRDSFMRPSRRGHYLAHMRTGLGQRSGLVEHHRIRLRQNLKEAPALDQHPAPRALADGCLLYTSFEFQ